MYKYTAKQIGDEIEISYYPTPEPKLKSNSFSDTAIYTVLKDKWLKTIKKSYLKKEFHDEFCKLIWKCSKNELSSPECDIFCKGISIDAIKHRLELIASDNNSIIKFEPFFILKQ